MIDRLCSAIVVASLIGGAAATPVSALTYVIVAEGAGLSSSFLSPSFTPNTTNFNALRIQYTVPDMAGLSTFYLYTNHGPGVLNASMTGLGMSFNGTTGVGNEILSGGACFSNPSGLLPTGAVSLIPGCGSVSYSAQGRYRLDQFIGRVVSLDILNDSYSGSPAIFAAQVANVPEPASWLMLIAGFGAIGATARRYRSQRRKALSG